MGTANSKKKLTPENSLPVTVEQVRTHLLRYDTSLNALPHEAYRVLAEHSSNILADPSHPLHNDLNPPCSDLPDPSLLPVPLGL